MLEASELLPSVIGGIIGALAGGIPAWLLAKRQSNETLARDREERREKEKSLAFAVCVKLHEISNSLILLRNHFVQSEILRQLPENAHMEPWQALRPLSGSTQEGLIRFEPEEMAVFFAAKQRDFMMDTMLIAARHASTLASFSEYCERRARFSSIAPVPVSFEGEIGRAWVNEDQRRSMMVHTIPLNNLATTLFTHLNDDVALARSVCERFGPIVQSYFNDPSLPSLEIPSDAELDAIVASGMQSTEQRG